MRWNLPNQRVSLALNGAGWRRLVGVCCMLLVLLSAGAELTHSHPSGRVNPECSLCVVAHSAAQTTVYTVAALVLRPVVRLVDPEPLFVRRSLEIRLVTRPPPVLSALS